MRTSRELGKTIFLTTHYMDEAQALADRVAVIADGRIVAAGTPDTLGGRDHAASDVSFTLPPGYQPADLPAELAGGGILRGEVFHLTTRELARVLHVLSGWALDRELELPDLSVGRPTLEDVYLQLTEPPEAST